MLIVPGAVMLADVTYVNEKIVPLMKTLSVGSFNAADLADGLAIVMVIAGGIILCIATLGICGACKKTRSCLCVVRNPPPPKKTKKKKQKQKKKKKNTHTQFVVTCVTYCFFVC